MPDLSKFRECIEPPILSEYSLEMMKQYIVLWRKRLTKLKLSLIFIWFIDHKKRYQIMKILIIYEIPSQSPTFAKMLTSPTQNEIANSQRKLNCACKNKIKKLKSCFTQSFKISPCLLFIQSSLSLLTST